MKRYVCIHGHFYQPPRENPWLEEVELQESAAPYHDWNARINAECYEANAFARLLGEDGTIRGIVNNYAWISFNFGPTLLSWMERHQPATYAAILEADSSSMQHFGGHGSALAQVYNHIIMPLADRRDKITQVRWGIRDFEHRFGRFPEGMWLAETAADTETLEVLAEHGIRFTILSPYQAARVRDAGTTDWTDVRGGHVDPRVAYRCNLPSGRSIDLFFYDGPVSQEIAFGDLLHNGGTLANRMLGLLPGQSDSAGAALAHIATDGETYGHHHRSGEMALAYCIERLRHTESVEFTIYGQFLEEHPPTREVEIVERSSWSCVHGVERWRAACGCNSGGNPRWQQQWRGPLRAALDVIRDSLRIVYERKAGDIFRDPWEVRNRYINFMIDRSPAGFRRFIAEEAPGLDPRFHEETVSLLEMQRNCLLMYTSCGWFFDEISGIETVQILQYASRALQLCRKVGGADPTPRFLEVLRQAPSNLPQHPSGDIVYQRYVSEQSVELERVAVHYAVTKLFQIEGAGSTLSGFDVQPVEIIREEAGRNLFVAGMVRVRSRITTEERRIVFAVLNLGDHNLFGGALSAGRAHNWAEHRLRFQRQFLHHETPRLIVELDEMFGSDTRILEQLFVDDQTAVIEQMLQSPQLALHESHRKLINDNYAMLQSVSRMGGKLPDDLHHTVRRVLTRDLRKAFEKDVLDVADIDNCVQRFIRWKMHPHGEGFSLVISRRLCRLMDELAARPDDLTAIDALLFTLDLIDDFAVDIDLAEVQNRFYLLCLATFDESRMTDGEWPQVLVYLGEHLNMDAAAMVQGTQRLSS